MKGLSGCICIFCWMMKWYVISSSSVVWQAISSYDILRDQHYCAAAIRVEQTQVSPELSTHVAFSSSNLALQEWREASQPPHSMLAINDGLLPPIIPCALQSKVDELIAWAVMLWRDPGLDVLCKVYTQMTDNVLHHWRPSDAPFAFLYLADELSSIPRALICKHSQAGHHLGPCWQRRWVFFCCADPILQDQAL